MSANLVHGITGDLEVEGHDDTWPSRNSKNPYKRVNKPKTLT